MTIKFITCRRKDDHTDVVEIAEPSLFYHTDYEPVPRVEDDEEVVSDVSVSTNESSTDTGDEPTTRKSRTRAVKKDEE